MSDADNDPVLRIKMHRYEADIAEAEARGYARGVEDAARACEDKCIHWRLVENPQQQHWADAASILTEAIVNLLKPKGEAK